MKNLKVSMKLIVGFLIAVALTAVVGGVGIYGLLTASSATSHMYDYNTAPMPYMSKAIETMQRMRVNTRQYIVYIVDHDMDGVEQTYTTIENYKKAITEALNNFDASTDEPNIQRIFDRARASYDNEYKAHLQRVYELARQGDYPGIIDDLDYSRSVIDQIVADFDQCMELLVEDAHLADAGNDTMTKTLLIVIIAVLVISVVISLGLAFYISGLISKPLGNISKALDLIGSKGDLAMPPTLRKARRSAHRGRMKSA